MFRAKYPKTMIGLGFKVRSQTCGFRFRLPGLRLRGLGLRVLVQFKASWIPRVAEGNLRRQGFRV